MHVEPVAVIHVIKIFGKMISIWPSDFNSKIYKVGKIQQLRWLITFLNVICLLIPLILGIYYNRNNSVTLMKTLTELATLTDVFFNLIIYKIQGKRLHKLLFEMTEYAKTVTSRDGVIFKKNVNRYVPFCMTIGSIYLQLAIIFCFTPFFKSQMLPADAWYPFPIQVSTATYYIIYLQHVLAILHTALCIVADFTIAMLLCYISTKLEILSIEIEQVESNEQLNKCIKEHQNCINFVDEICRAARYVIMKFNITMAAAIICSAFPIIHHEPLPVIYQFLLMICGGCIRLYISAWPADDLREKGSNISQSIYNSKWTNGTLGMKKSILIMIHRAQKPLVISSLGILPPVTRQYYAAFLSTTLSYFMTVRAVMAS